MSRKGSRKKGKIKDQKVDVFYIPSSTVQKMNELDYNTYKTGREQGMALCLDKKDRVVPGNESQGSQNMIEVPETCKSRSDKFIGSFHTHPRPSETKFSAMDLLSSCNVRSKLDCVGMNRRGEIVCFTKKNRNKSCQKEAEALVKIENLYEELYNKDPQLYEDTKEVVLDSVDKIVDKRFIEKKIL